MKAFKIIYCPTYNVPKSNVGFWAPFPSTINRENSTDVACISILSLTSIDYDFSIIDPLNSPGSVALYFIVTFASSFGDILSIFGSTDSTAPWSC